MKMIVYQVDIEVAKGSEKEWVDFMREHIIDVLNTKCFSDFNIRKKLEYEFNSASMNEGSNQFAYYQIEYFSPNLERFDKYIKEYSAKLQREHTERFGNSTKASRKIYSDEFKQVFSELKPIADYVTAPEI